MKYAVIGFGSRGATYTDIFHKLGHDSLAAVCDNNPLRRELAENSAEAPLLFADADEFFAAGKLADLCIIATPDNLHAEHALKAMRCGYDLLLEKPIACNIEDCKQIAATAASLNRKVFVCHVLRYSRFFRTIKEELSSGKYGKTVTSSIIENVAWWHQAHSYVRGNWRDTNKTSPMIIAKSCHDLDILNWLTDSDCESVSSVGSLGYFTAANAPENSGPDCYHCNAAKDCIYDCEKIYFERFFLHKGNRWPVDVILQEREPTHEMLTAALKSSPYSRCVFRCDNNAVDHQIVNILYTNGATAQLTMTAFSEDNYREIHVHCEKGEICGNMKDNLLTCRIFGNETFTIDLKRQPDNEDRGFGHGGGDYLMIKDISEAYRGKQAACLTGIEQSLSSHFLGFAAEQSRLKKGKPIQVIH